MTRAAATRHWRGIIPRLTEINSSLPQTANVQSTPRRQTPQTAASTKLQIIPLSNPFDHTAVV